MILIERCLIALLVLWALASFCYALQLPRLAALLLRFNHFGTFASWTMFSGRRSPATTTSRLGLEYRDEGIGAQSEGWLTVQPDGWSHFLSFFWAPGRHVSRRVGDLCEMVKTCAERKPPAANSLRENMTILANYLRTIHPPTPGVKREIRVVQSCHSSTDAFGVKASRRVIATVTESSHDS